MGFQNFFATRLATDITAVDSTITLETAPVETSGRLTLEARNPTQREIIRYTGVSGNQITGVSRGEGGTTAKPHLKGALVEMNLTAEDLEDAINVPNDVITRFDEMFSDNVVRGTGTVATVSGLTGSIADITYYIDGVRFNETGISNKVFTASKDTYCRIDTNGNVSYDEVANGAAQPSLPVGNIWFAKVVTDVSSITSITQMGVGAVSADELDTDTFSYVSASGSGTQSISSGSPGSTAIFNSESEDTLTEYDTSTGTFTAQKAGIYSVSTAVRWSAAISTGTIVLLAIDLNGNAVITRNDRTIQENTTQNLSAVVKMGANDTITIRLRQDTGSSVNINRASSYLTIARIA